MIFQFPDLETFRLAVTSAQVPPEVSALPAEVAFDPEGRPSVRSVAGILPRQMQTALRKLGVKPAKDHFAEAVLTVDCWPQVLPVRKAAAVPEVTSNTPVLFELPVGEMPTLVTEMLRLGNDRQSFRTLAPADGKGDRVLLRVIGPPYYTLLRAIDKATHKGATVTAYVEKAPRVWIELGYDHPMAGQIKPAEGQVLFLRPERDWSVVEDGPFQDVYEVLDFKLPAAPVEWQAAQLKGKLSVPLKLAPGNAADPAELWVLTEEAVDQLDALVRDADDRLLSRLSFAVARENGQTTIVLKTRPSRLSAPVLPLARALGFKPYWKLPNLFLPVGKRLMPTLRRDAVRKLLADDPAQVVWLMPQADGRFTPEVLPDDAFRPLEDWIDYVIDHEHDRLAAWVQATHFDFDSFICMDEPADRPKPPPEKSRKARKDGRDGGAEEAEPPPAPKGAKKKAPAADETGAMPLAESAPPGELKVRLREVEGRFKAVDGPLDAPERVALWPELARLYSGLNEKSEAAVCWANAFWDLPEVPADGSWGWLHGEDPAAQPVPTADEWDAALTAHMPSPEAARGFVARVVHACRQDPVPDSFVCRLPKVREYLERHESVLGVRAVWLAWWHLVRAGGPADVLALARVRDRLLQRLLTEGLNKERDLPYFLRTAGEQNSERMRLVRDRAMRVHRLVEQWHAGEDVKVNKPYVDLMFAFGLAKLGETTAARDLMQLVGDRLLEPAAGTGKPDPAHEFLLKAFVWRIENALQGKPHTGTLPKEMMDGLERIDASRGNTLGWRYIVDSLREHSWILEPQDRTKAYARWAKYDDAGRRSLVELGQEPEPRRLEDGIKKVLRAAQTPEARLIALASIMALAGRVGEEVAISLVQQAPAALNAVAWLKAPKEHLAGLAKEERALLERALFLAAHYDRPELVQSVFECMLEYVRTRPEEDRHAAISELARVCLRSLRKLGLKDEIDRFLRQTTEMVVQGKGLAQLRRDAGARWPDMLASLLALAEGWLYFGGRTQAEPFLQAARDTIFENGRTTATKLLPLPMLKVVTAYVSALGQAPVDETLNRIEELFKEMERLPNGFTTHTHYSRVHLGIVEEVVRSLMTDNIALGDQARRWLDDDEYLVRRRIHKDMRTALAGQGL